MRIKFKKLFITSLIFSQFFLVNNTSYADSIILNKEKTDGVNVRSEEDINSEILGGIEDFSLYEIKGESDDWFEIEFEGEKGYVGKDWFYRLNHTSIVNPTELKESPDDDSENLTENKLQAKTKVTILEFDKDNDYVKISYDLAFKDNKAINNIDINSIENSSLLYNLSEDTDTIIKTVTLGDEDKNEVSIPSVVTLSDVPQTLAMTEEIAHGDGYEGPIEGYVKLDSLAIADDEDLDDILAFYDDMNEAIGTRLAYEESLLNQVREITTVEYVTTTTYQTVMQESPTSTQLADANTIMVPVSGSEVGIDLYKWATQFVGRPYVLGGTSLTNGIDCSGFTMRIYQQVGIGLPHFAQSQQRYGIEIPFGQEQAGDLVFFGTSLNNITHVGMADGHGNMIHASSPRVGIIISPIRNPISIKRIVQ